MSLVQVLASKSVDKGLDDIFKSSAGPSAFAVAVTKPVQADPILQKRKSENISDSKISKKLRVTDGSASRGSDFTYDGKGKAKQQESDAEQGEESEDEDLSDQDETTSTVPTHESVTKSSKPMKSLRRKKYTPEGETREQRDARTVFIGNLPVAVVKSKPLTKRLKRHILSHVPSAKVESIRFRSVAFHNPTSTLEDEDDGKTTKAKRQQARAAEWKALHADTDPSSTRDAEAEEDKKGEKKYMTPAEKRRLAAIKGDLHEHGSATTNAYIVFAYPAPVSTDEQVARVPKKEVMDPFAAAREAVHKIHGTFFADHMLRVDLSGKSTEAAQDLDASTGILTDPRLSIFVGNLDFVSCEDDVRAFFEQLICEECGKPDTVAKKDGNDEFSRNLTWVTRVRIVRDRDTQLGKGFAYVQFSDRDCVDEVLAIGAEKLKFAKRTLRVQRCKTLPSLTTTRSKEQQQPSAKTTSRNSSRSLAAPKPLPKGDPALGTRLAGLPKEERKKAKASDPARVARRLAKKKARMALDKTERGSKEMRVRERKDKKTKGEIKTGKEKKKRERSVRNLQRKNLKK